MKSNIIVNTIENTITVSESFYKKASVYGTAEYAELRNATLDNPAFKIVFKATERKTYHGLTFDRMADYIKTQPHSEIRMREFEAVKTIADAKGGKYPLTKKWFLATYPEYKENRVSEDEAASLIAEAAEKPALAESDAA